MRNAQVYILQGVSDADIQTSNAIDANQIVSSSFQVYFGDATVDGTFLLQASNDPAYMRSSFTPSNWSDIGTLSITNGISQILAVTQMCYSWIRTKWTPSAGLLQTISNSGTGLTFAITGGGTSTVNVVMNSLSY